MTPRRNGNGGIAPYRKRADAKNRRQNPYKPLHFNLLCRVGGISQYNPSKAMMPSRRRQIPCPVPRRRAQRIRRTPDSAQQTRLHTVLTLRARIVPDETPEITLRKPMSLRVLHPRFTGHSLYGKPCKTVSRLHTSARNRTDTAVRFRRIRRNACNPSRSGNAFP